jgi:hypothetical protein
MFSIDPKERENPLPPVTPPSRETPLPNPN